MRIHYPTLCNIVHSLSLNVFTAFKGTDFYVFIHDSQIMFHPYRLYPQNPTALEIQHSKTNVTWYPIYMGGGVVSFAQ